MQTIDQLSFLTGAWRQGATLELHFTAAKGGTLLGTLRQFEAGATRYFEFLAFKETPLGLVLDLFPRGQHVGTCPYTATEADGRRFVFTNPAQPEFRHVWFEGDATGSCLCMGTRGEKAGHSYERTWRFEPHASAFF